MHGPGPLGPGPYMAIHRHLQLNWTALLATGTHQHRSSPTPRTCVPPFCCGGASVIHHSPASGPELQAGCTRTWVHVHVLSRSSKDGYSALRSPCVYVVSVDPDSRVITNQPPELPVGPAPLHHRSLISTTKIPWSSGLNRAHSYNLGKQQQAPSTAHHQINNQ